MKSWFTIIFLGLSGLLLLAIGCAILFAPHSFYATNGIELSDDPSLLSEIRAPGGLLAAIAILVLIGAIRSGQRSLALMLTIVSFGSFVSVKATPL